MKNSLILSMGMLACFSLSAQTAPLKRMPLSKAEKPFLKSFHQRTSGTEAVLWSEDFSGGIPGTWTNEVRSSTGVLLPNGFWEYRGPATTPNNTVGSRGAWAAGTGPIVSPTAGNGFVIFDSDFMDNNGVPDPTAVGSGPAPAPHIAVLETDAIDLSGTPFVELKVNTHARQWNTTEFKIAISNDGGLTYVDTLELHDDLQTNASNAANDVFTANISPVAGNQANVVLAFIFDGTQGNAGFQSYYYWMLDDNEIRDLPLNEMRFTVASDGAPPHDIIYDGGGLTQPRLGNISMSEIVPINFDSNVYNYGSNTQTNVTFSVEIFNGGTSPVATMSSNSVASIGMLDTVTYVDFVTPPWTPPGPGTYRLVYTFQSDDISSAMAVRDTFNLFVTEGDSIQGNSTRDINGLDFGVFSNRFGTNNPDFGSDGGGIGVMIPLENGNSRGEVLVEGIQVRFSVATIDGGDMLVEIYDTTGFDLVAGFGSQPLVSEQFNLGTGTSGSLSDFIFTSGSGPNGAVILPEGTYYFVIYLFSNSNTNEIIIANDQTFAQVGPASIMYYVSDSRWYIGFGGGSRVFNAPWIRSISDVVEGIGLEENDNNQLSVFPNPTNGEVNITLAKGGKYTFELIDLIGNVISQEEVVLNGNEKLTRDFSDLTKGIYLLHVNGENFVSTTKLTVQ